MKGEKKVCRLHRRRESNLGGSLSSLRAWQLRAGQVEENVSPHHDTQTWIRPTRLRVFTSRRDSGKSIPLPYTSLSYRSQLNTMAPIFMSVAARY